MTKPLRGLVMDLVAVIASTSGARAQERPSEIMADLIWFGHLLGRAMLVSTFSPASQVELSTLLLLHCLKGLLSTDGGMVRMVPTGRRLMISDMLMGTFRRGSV